MYEKWVDKLEENITFNSPEAKDEYYKYLGFIVNSGGLKSELEFYNHIINDLKIQNCNSYISRAVSYEREMKYKQALRDYRIFIMLSKQNKENYGEISYAYSEMAKIYYELKDYKKVTKYIKNSLKTASDKKPKTKYVYNPYSNALHYSKDLNFIFCEELLYEIGEYDKVLSLISENKADLYYKAKERIIHAKTLIKLNKYDEVLEIIEKTNKFDKLILKAKLEEAKNNIEEAIKYYIQAETTEDSSREYSHSYVYEKLGKYYEEQNDYKKAFEYYNKIGDCTFLGDLNFKLTQYEKALMYYFEELLKQYNSTEVTARLNYKIGLTKKMLGRNEEAVQYFDRAKSIEKNNEEYKKAYEELKDFDKNPFREDGLFYGLLGDMGPFEFSREVGKIVEDIFDDWLDKEEIDDESVRYMMQLLSCKSKDDKINNDTVENIIKEFLEHIECLYTTEKAEDLKQELLRA